MSRAGFVERSRLRWEARRPRAAQLPSTVGYVSDLRRWVRGVHAEVLRGFGMRTDALDPSTHALLKAGTARLRVELAEVPLPMRAVDKAAERVADHAEKESRRLLGIQPSADLERLIETWRHQNVRLIRSLPQRLLDDVESTLEEFSGASVADLAAELQERFAVNTADADLIARDQTLKLNGQIQRAEQESVGCESYIWTTSKDERVRDAHADLDGQEFRWDDPPVVDAKTGRREHPGGDYQCRCTAFPVLPDLDAILEE